MCRLKKMCWKTAANNGEHKKDVSQASRVDLCNRVLPERVFDCDHRIVCTWACFLISHGCELSRHMTPPALYYTLQIPARESGSRDENKKNKKRNSHLESYIWQNPVAQIKEGRPGCRALELKASFLAVKGYHKRALMTAPSKPVYGNGFCSQIEEFQKCFTCELRLLWEKKKWGWGAEENLKKSYLQHQEWG